MRHRLTASAAIGFSVLAACGCVYVVWPADALPPGAPSRVVDSLPSMAIVEFADTYTRPSLRLRYISDEKGLRRLTLQDISRFVAEKHATDPGSSVQVIRDTIALDNVYETLILSSARDIPGFRPEQVDPDLLWVSVAPCHFSLRDYPDATVTIIYTWTPVGGELKRYRFVTPKGGVPYCESCASLQRRLGDAVYLE